jgi:hypothetical protein
MKIIYFFLFFLVASNSFAQDTMVAKPHPSYLQVHSGYAVYVDPLFKGAYLSLGYKHNLYKFLWYNAQVFLMEGKYKTESTYISFSWPTIQIKSISTGLSGEYAFYKRHSIEAGAGLNFSVIRRSIGYDSRGREIFYGPFRTINWGYYGSFSYLYRISSRLKTGLVYNKTVIRQDRFHSPYQLDIYGLILQLKF